MNSDRPKRKSQSKPSFLRSETLKILLEEKIDQYMPYVDILAKVNSIQEPSRAHLLIPLVDEFHAYWDAVTSHSPRVRNAPQHETDQLKKTITPYNCFRLPIWNEAQLHSIRTNTDRDPVFRIGRMLRII